MINFILHTFYFSTFLSCVLWFFYVIIKASKLVFYLFKMTAQPNNSAAWGTNDQGSEILLLDESGAFKVFNTANQTFSKYQENQPLRAVPKSNSVSVNDDLPMETGIGGVMFAPLLPTIKDKNAAFYFHPTDEEEVAGIAKKMKPVKEDFKKYSLNKIWLKIKEHYQLALTEEEVKRFKTIIFNYLRDRKTSLATSASLIQSSATGGLSLAPELADKLLSFLKEIKEKIKVAGGLVVEEIEDPLATAAWPPEVKAPVISPFDQLNGVLRPQAAVNNQSETRVSPPVGQAKVNSNPIIRRPLKKLNYQFLDVKKDSRLMGPVDELEVLNLETFRRLGVNTAERINKLSVKFKLLAKDSLVKRATGIAAWRSCPLYKMYMAVGEASLNGDLTAEQIIAKYSAQGKVIMNFEEFNAISDLNKELRS